MPEVSNNGVRIIYDVVGRGRPLILLHGWCCDRSWWTEPGYVDDLEPGSPVDQRGPSRPRGERQASRAGRVPRGHPDERRARRCRCGGPRPVRRMGSVLWWLDCVDDVRRRSGARPRDRHHRCVGSEAGNGGRLAVVRRGMGRGAPARRDEDPGRPVRAGEKG